MAKYTFVVMSNPTTPGQEAEYNEWYNKIHIPDVLNVPGFVAAQRFKVAESGGPSWLWWWGQKDAQPDRHSGSHRYMVLYEIETEDPQATLDDLKKRAAGMVISDAIDMKGISVALFQPAAERVLAKDVQRSRREV